MDMSLDRLKIILKQHIGLEASTVGDATIKKFLSQRMRSCDIDDCNEYFSFLENNPQELAALLETAVIPETWFFRDSKPFAIVLQRLQQHLAKTPQQLFRILSIPCSTGEEPYSLAMYLLESGMPPDCFTIQAVDVSNNSLQLARLGRYGSNSFRGKTEQIYLQKYFTRDDENYLIKDLVKSVIDFKQLNILEQHQLKQARYFDIIMCRNLLIYFDVDTKTTAFGNLNKILKDDGILFIGHSEFGAVPAKFFSTTGADNSFGLIKPVARADNTSKQNKPVRTDKDNRKTRRSKPDPIAPQERAFASVKPDSSKEATQADAISSSDANELIDRARQLADAGCLKEAEELCHKIIDETGDSAETFFLLGLISQASGTTKLAEDLFRKALYLEPRHYHSLVHLALIVDQSGDTGAADLLRQRAARVAVDS